ncbi:coiled-coil domain-containing protein [Paenibacillus nasutitermitis]|uniref:N-terminal domain of peptidoglycan hydrolase CwlO-containing protein n=1 Tax=Paenibacillus nasutitermitis TaxID=1652958 RepID=A0A916Z1B6_9BACL|nr:hypothetical protein [Paenibacillus nasutitermitis]GGD71157.1 hypothetical protein GCM10010911_31300 [Paenibacillus nasutitermitis]
MRATKRRRLLAFAASAFAVWLTIFPVLAQSPEDEEIRRIMEKSLSVVELDKEIARIADQQKTISGQLDQTRTTLADQEQAMDKHRKDAGAILRAYYTGERDILMNAVLNAGNLTDLLTMLDYFNFIFSSDRQTMNHYKEQYRSLQKGVQQMDKESRQLADVETRLKEQRERVLALTRDVDSSLSGRSDADRLRLMISEMTDFWKNVGLFEVRKYFSALAKAMKNLPDWVQNDKDLLQIDGFNYTLTIPEEKLNAFLRQQNELFRNFAFSFSGGVVTVTGQRDGLEVKLTGRYTVEETDEGTAILFHVEELVFNGLALPDTTRQSLEDEFDLGFYPQRIVSFLKAKSVSIEDGNLIVKLAVKL